MSRHLLIAYASGRPLVDFQRSVHSGGWNVPCAGSLPEANPMPDEENKYMLVHPTTEVAAQRCTMLRWVACGVSRTSQTSDLDETNTGHASAIPMPPQTSASLLPSL